MVIVYLAIAILSGLLHVVSFWTEWHLVAMLTAPLSASAAATVAALTHNIRAVGVATTQTSKAK